MLLPFILDSQQIACEDVQVGDIVYVRENDEIPADLVVLKTSHTPPARSEPKDAAVRSLNSSCSAVSIEPPQTASTASLGGSGSAQLCFIETANIDGETHLKERTALAETARLSVAELAALRCVIACAEPNNKIYAFDSTLTVLAGSNGGGDLELSLGPQQLLLQATYLRHTQWAYGVAVYTGDESKVGQNKQDPNAHVKWTPLDRRINHAIVAIFALQIALVVALGAAGNQV
jgi:magnesium-transporting ATPase (P-type)